MLLTRFRQDRRASLAPMFGLALVPLVGAVGVALDYSRASAARTQMQSALDATALYLSREAQSLTSEELNRRAQQYFNANFKNNYSYDVVVTSSLSINSNQLYTIKVAAAASVDTTFSRVLGHTKMEVGSASEVVWGMKRLELVLALDNTGSMASYNRLTELKKATKALLDTLHKAAKKTDDVKVAIVPFTTDVNVGSANAGANWLDWAAWDENNGSCSGKNGSRYTTKTSCTADGRTWTPISKSDWNGCVWDRNQDHDVKDTAPDSISSQFQPHQASGCPTSMIALSDILQNWKPDDLKSSSPTSTFGKKVNAMTANGYTNITIGLAWAWHALTASEPLTQASPPKHDLDKVIVLMTDGDNTANRFNSFNSNISQIDMRTQKVCENVKAAGIRLYTVRLMEGNATLLRECATNPGMYYDVQQAAQLSAVFGHIAQNLASLRISK